MMLADASVIPLALLLLIVGLAAFGGFIVYALLRGVIGLLRLVGHGAAVVLGVTPAASGPARLRRGRTARTRGAAPPVVRRLCGHPGCGFRNRPDARYCAGCGRPILMGHEQGAHG